MSAARGEVRRHGRPGRFQGEQRRPGAARCLEVALGSTAGYKDPRRQIARARRLASPSPLSPRWTVKSRCDPPWFAQVLAEVERNGVDEDRGRAAHRHLPGPDLWPRRRPVRDVRHPACALLRPGVRGRRPSCAPAGVGPAVPAEPARPAGARSPPEALPGAESDASLGSRSAEFCEGGTVMASLDRSTMRALRSMRRGDRVSP